nr:hypothetical protein CFP56_03401 [Quercus suber]
MRHCLLFEDLTKDLLFTSESIKRAALQAISNDQVSVPSLVVAVFTHDLWLDHYECYCQLFEDVYATCRRTQLCCWLASLLVGDKCNFKVNIELELGFGQSLRIIKMPELMECLLINTTVWLGHW